MAATVVGVFVRQAGVWERANGGTPTGFSGPQVRSGGLWRNSVVVYGKAASNWQETWVNIDGELNVQTVTSILLTATDFSGPSYQGFVQVEFDANGTFGYRAYNNNSPAPARTEPSGQWRRFDCGREYQIWYQIDKDQGGGSFSDGIAVANTWVDISSDVNFEHSYSIFDTGIVAEFSEVDFTVRIREKVSAPPSGNDSASYQTTIELGIGI